MGKLKGPQTSVPTITQLPNSPVTQSSPGTFNLSAVSVMLERYDTSGRSRVRLRKGAETQPANRFDNRDRVDCGWPWLVVSLLAGRTRCPPLLRRAAATGLQHRLRHLDARSRSGSSIRNSIRNIRSTSSIAIGDRAANGASSRPRKYMAPARVPAAAAAWLSTLW